MATIYAYVRFLREEPNGISIRSLPQYLAAICIVHQARGLLGWTCFDGVMRRLVGAWGRAVPMPPVHTTPVSANVFMAILECGLATDSISTLRQCCSVCLDYVFMSRTESTFYILQEDIVIVPSESLGFRERRSKLTRARLQGTRFRATSLRGLPQLGDLLLQWEATRDSAWAATSAPPSPHFWLLPGENALQSATISGWFSTLLRDHPELAQGLLDLHHHNLRAGGASACFALEVPERRIRAWGGWRGGSAFWKYIDVDRQPTEADFRTFSWMTIRAGDLHVRLAPLFLPPLADK